MAYKIIAEKCIQCDACRLECPRNAITNADSESTYVIDQEKCNDCVTCPQSDAITVNLKNMFRSHDQTCHDY